MNDMLQYSSHCLDLGLFASLLNSCRIQQPEFQVSKRTEAERQMFNDLHSLSGHKKLLRMGSMS